MNTPHVECTINRAATSSAELDSKFDLLRKEIDVRFAKVDGELKLLRWMLGTLIAIGVTGVAGIGSLVIRTFF